MQPKNGRLVAVVAAVAVAAIAGGGTAAYRQSPQVAEAAEAAPLSSTPSPPPSASGPTGTPTATPMPSSSPAPSKTPVTTPTRTPTRSGPVKTNVDLKKLAPGRAPQIAYLSGRTVRGGAGPNLEIPGSQQIQQVARLRQSALAVVSAGDNSTEMLTIDRDGKVVGKTPDVSQVVTTEDGMAAAYLTSLVSDQGEQSPGTTLYVAEQEVRKVTVPDVWNATLLGYVNGKVYFQASDKEASGTWTLYEWTPGAKVTPIKSVPKPTAVSPDGTTAASLTTLTDYNSCTSILEIATGKRLWRTCDYQIDGFTHDGTTAIGGPFYRDGYGDGLAAALDVKTGTLLHEWSGVFRQAVAEDDQHLLLLADTGEETPASIIRCTISTGACELATPLAKGTLLIGS
ncbi:MAG TPA: hypothetical protein VIH10_11900 [Kribbella sp.]